MFRIFRDDIRVLSRNTIALIIIMGLTIVPSLYAWFNIAASWDPYKNTGGLRIAVANTDSGYSGDLIPLSVNIGDRVVASLRENTQMGWVFTDEADAINGVQSGKYYAAVVLPEDFSDDMLSLFSGDMHKAEIHYYLNEKENAIAPKITNKGASAVEHQINEVFAQTLSEIALGLSESLSASVQEDDLQALAAHFQFNMGLMADDLQAAANLLDSYASLMQTMHRLLDVSAEMLDGSDEKLEHSKTVIAESSEQLSVVQATVQGTTDRINEALVQLGITYDRMAEETDFVLDLTGEDVNDARQNLESTAAKMDAQAEDLLALEQSVKQLREVIASIEIPETPGTDVPDIEIPDMELPDVEVPDDVTEKLPERDPEVQRQMLLQALDTFLDDIAYAQTTERKAAGLMRDASGKLYTPMNNVNTFYRDLKKTIEDSRASIHVLQKDYEDNVATGLLELVATLDETGTTMTALLDQLGIALDDIEALGTDTGAQLDRIQRQLEETSGTVRAAAQRLNRMAGRISGPEADPMVETVLQSSPEDISRFVAAPVVLKETRFYPVENYGSAMAPFYTTLAIWFGAIALVAIMKVAVSADRRKKMKNLKGHQLYLGRALLFVMLGLIQAMIICLGDLYFVGIQCVSPLHFILAACFSAVVYVMLMYTLTVLMGDIGKAAAVILLVIQVAGSGGTFPIEMIPAIFQKVYLLLPFTHTMTAMREAIAGFYGNVYWTEMLHLSWYLLGTLFCGLVLRKPLIRLNVWIIEKMEETKLM